MTLYLDTSALIKRYIEETGSVELEKILDKAEKIVVSQVTRLEAYSTLRRLLDEKRIDEEAYRLLLEEIDHDIMDLNMIPFDGQVESKAGEMIGKHKLKTLDSIQLASCLVHRSFVDLFVCCDKRLNIAAKSEGLDITDPTIPPA